MCRSPKTTIKFPIWKTGRLTVHANSACQAAAVKPQTPSHSGWWREGELVGEANSAKQLASLPAPLPRRQKFSHRVPRLDFDLRICVFAFGE